MDRPGRHLTSRGVRGSGVTREASGGCTAGISFPNKAYAGTLGEGRICYVDPIQNPYAPGAGQRPPDLAGREDELASFDVLIQRLEANRPERGLMLTGLRGVGKTVLLEEFRSRAEARGWVVAFVEGGSRRPFRLLAAQALTSSLRAASLRHRSSATLRRAVGVFKAFSLQASPDGSLSVGIDVAPVSGRADSGDLELDLTELLADLGDAAREINQGVVLLVDELQELPATDVEAIAGAAHHSNRRQLPVAIIGAGLPNLATVLSDAKSYAERLFSYPHVTALDADAARRALARPAADLDVTWEGEALSYTLEAAAGYPYFLQAFGKTIWDYAPGPTITLDDATVGVIAAQRELDHAFYGSRWERATPAQRTYLAAMTNQPNEVVATGDLAAGLGKTHSDLGPHRDQLIRKGLIYAPERGFVAFTVPGMDTYIRRLLA